VRYRDRNLEWSDWSDVKQFEITGSVVSNPTFTLNKTEYAQNEPIIATFTGGPGNQQDWVGIYKKGQTPHCHFSGYMYTNGQEQEQPLSIMVYLIKVSILQDFLPITDIQKLPKKNSM
jgi:hypothetical protein